MSLFLVDEKRKLHKTYRDLIKDLNAKTSTKKCIHSSNPYEIFVEILHSMTIGGSIVVIDSEYKEEDYPLLGLSHEDLGLELPAKKKPITDFVDLINRINANKQHWKISLYSSGTTGKPKKVTHSYDTAARQVRETYRSKRHVWGYAYNPTHFAGLQVLLQAFFNQNPMIYLFDADRKKISHYIHKYRVTHLSATPTFYRTLLANMTDQALRIKHITFGGEKYDPNLENKLKILFPGAVFTNVYASTEAGSLFRSRGEWFEIPEELVALIHISEDQELMIHKSLLAFRDDLSEASDAEPWYHTGDIIEEAVGNCFRFVSRKSELINVGGYKVNPYEVEEEILKVEGVADAIVFGRKNSVMGNILVAEVQKHNEYADEDIVRSIVEALSKRLPKWKVPMKINLCSEIHKTRTGKKVRI